MKKLLEYIDNPNIAQELDEEVLKDIGKKVCEDYSSDRDSMADWSQSVDAGIKIAKPATEGKQSFPWEGASNYKSPLIYKAVFQFGDRASVELLGNKDLVKASAENDSDEITMRKTRVAKFMNWQFNYEMQEWREQQESLLYELACIGVVFKKTYFDPTEGKNVSGVIHYPNFAINNDTTMAGLLPRFTECKNYTQNEIQERVTSGIWIKPDLLNDDKDEDDKVFSSDDDQEEQDDIQDDFIEQYTNYDLDDDGYAEPYIVTVHKPTQSVVRIVARYDQQCIYVKQGKGIVAKFDAALQRRTQELAQEKAQELQQEIATAQMTGEELPEINPQDFLEEMQNEAMEGLEVVKIKPHQHITKYGFVNDPEGRYLNWGYCHLLRGYSEIINTTTNQLIDSGTMANIPGGFTSQEFRSNRKPMRVAPGQFSQVDVPASVLQQGLQYFQFRGPDPQLAALNEQNKAEASDLAATVNLQDAIAPNAPAATTLGILQEKLTPTTALMRRILQSMGKEFRIMAELNQRYTDPMTYQQVVNEPADYRVDFESSTHDIQVTANNAMTSAVQKMQTASVLSAEIPNIQQSGGDVRPIMKYIFEGIGSNELFNQVYPDPNALSPQEQQAMQRQQQLQEQQLQQQELSNQLSQANLREQELKNQLKEYELQIKQQEQQRKVAETSAKIDSEQREYQLKVAELEQEAVSDSNDKALELTKLEQEQGRQLDQEMQANILVFNPVTGELE